MEPILPLQAAPFESEMKFWRSKILDLNVFNNETILFSKQELDAIRAIVDEHEEISIDSAFVLPHPIKLENDIHESIDSHVMSVPMPFTPTEDQQFAQEDQFNQVNLNSGQLVSISGAMPLTPIDEQQFAQDDQSNQMNSNSDQLGSVSGAVSITPNVRKLCNNQLSFWVSHTSIVFVTITLSFLERSDDNGCSR